MNVENEIIEILKNAPRIDKMVQELKQELKARVASIPFRGEVISDGENGKPFFGIQKASNLFTKWSPTYHIPKAQAQAVEYRLSKCKTPNSVCVAIREMIKKKWVANDSIRYAFYYGRVTYLNNETLEVLRNSEIGKYALAHAPQKEKEQGAAA